MFITVYLLLQNKLSAEEDEASSVNVTKTSDELKEGRSYSNWNLNIPTGFDLNLLIPRQT